MAPIVRSGAPGKLIHEKKPEVENTRLRLPLMMQS
jgi:hypothetical protein